MSALQSRFAAFGLVLAPAVLIAGSPSATRPMEPQAFAALNRLMADRGRLGLDEQNTFEVQDVEQDETGSSHVRLQQRYRGIRVWGGQAIAHTTPHGAEGSLTNALVQNLQVEVTPNLSPAEALAVARDTVAPKGSFARPPTTERVIYPESTLQPTLTGATNAEDFKMALVRIHLAYHIHMELENGPQETRHDDFLVDAHTGAILKTWSTLFTLKSGAPVNTTGNSQYNGQVSLGSLSMPCGFILSDPTRNNISTRNLEGRTFGTGGLFSSPVPYWGDGQNYDAVKGYRSMNGQTAAVDAHYGLQTTWDFYKNILGRNGIDGRGTTPYNLVHYSEGYDNAFWSDHCFCMTYGDGNIFHTLTSLDVVGHEISHGLCHSTADLAYHGETGGLNESNSDIFGAMITFYAKGALGEGATIPDVGGRWSIGHDLQTASYPHPLRYMQKPSMDGSSPDAWSPDLDHMNVHFSSGPMNRAFYFLSQGASADKNDNGYSSFLPKGMAGIGNDKALRIWWRTLSTRLTPGSRYVDARNGAICAAEELFGKGSPEVWAVRRAFKAINVGRTEPRKRFIHTRSQDGVPMDTSS